MKGRQKTAKSAPVRTLRGAPAHREFLPALSLTGNVLFPGNTLPVHSVPGFGPKALVQARLKNQLFIVVPVAEDEAWEELQNPVIATKASIADLLHLPGGQVGIVLKGEERVMVRELQRKRSQRWALCEKVRSAVSRRSASYLALSRTLKAQVSRFLKTDADMTVETRELLLNQENPGALCDLLVPYLSVSFQEKRECLGAISELERMKKVIAGMQRELNLQKLTSEIHEQVKSDLSEEQRRQYLREQIAAIKRELGELDEATNAVEQFEEDFEEMELPPLAREAVWEELERLSFSSPGSPEFIVAHSYLSLMRDLPWEVTPVKPVNLKTAAKILDRDHFGLQDVKQRILEYLAVLRHKGDIPSQILLLNGPPGVGKTSLARSIAEALGRPFARISLGGVRDEAEIRGHRRTYIGAMPGKIIQAIKQTKTLSPVILLDEIDKLGGDSLGGIAAAMLEVLDREQNATFLDHYLAVPFDISNVLFIATSNGSDNILEPLRDRMELVDVPSYTEREKLVIAKRHIIPAVRKDLELKAEQFQLADKTLLALMRQYTHEAGVRQLKREVERLGRKVVLQVVTRKGRSCPVFSESNLADWLGVPKYYEEPRDKILPPGVAIGLAYTNIGGEIMYIETSVGVNTDGKGALKLTGNVGKVMQESAQAVLSFLAAQSEELGIPREKLQADIHIHLPDGGTPKDGPSAGIAIMCALTSALLKHPLPTYLCMTGEVTLRGQVLPVGGIREKVLAAHRYHKNVVLYPAGNERDLRDVPAEVREKLQLIPVTHMRQVLEIVGLLSAAGIAKSSGLYVAPPTLFS